MADILKTYLQTKYNMDNVKHQIQQKGQLDFIKVHTTTRILGQESLGHLHMKLMETYHTKSENR